MTTSEWDHDDPDDDPDRPATDPTWAPDGEQVWRGGRWVSAPKEPPR